MLEAHRIRQRTEYDLEMMQELGFCNGIENYSRILDGRPPGSAPHTLLDYFPSDFVVFVDESHQTIPQIGGMYEGDRSRKQTLVDFGFRLPSALDNRPLRFDEFLAKVPQLVMVSATPGAWELRHSTRVAEQLIRPTGIVDPEVELRPTRNQIDDLLNEIRRREERGERTLVTTLTKKMAEDLTDYLLEAGVRARYLHSEIDTLERIQIIRDLRLGEYDVLVGVNLLREGLDLPEVSLVAILDADKEGFLRGQTALIQTIGRAARNVNGTVLMYADKHTEAIQYALDETVAAPREAARLQRGARDHADLDLEGRLRHRRVPHARRAARAEAHRAAARRSRGWTAASSRSSSSRSRRRCSPPPRSSGSSTPRSSATRSRSSAASSWRSTRSRPRASAGNARVPVSSPGLAAPDIGLDDELLLVGPVDEDAAGLVGRLRARTAETGRRREHAGGRLPRHDLEVAALARSSPGGRGRPGSARRRRPQGAAAPCCDPRAAAFATATARPPAGGGARRPAVRPSAPLASRAIARSSSERRTRPRW